MSKELEALEIVRKELIKCHRLPNETHYDELDIIETALLKYEKLCKVINNIYETAHGEVKYKLDSVALAYFADKLKQVIDEDSK
jgi:hypothetical protein